MLVRFSIFHISYEVTVFIYRVKLLLVFSLKLPHSVFGLLSRRIKTPSSLSVVDNMTNQPKTKYLFFSCVVYNILLHDTCAACPYSEEQ